MVKVDNADKVLPPIQLPASCQLQNGQILKSDHPSLAELDLDGDGDIDMEDLHKLVHLKRSQETLIKTQKITVLVLSCIIIGVGVGLAVELKAAQSAIEGARVGSTVPHVELPLALQVPSGTAGAEESEHDTAVSVDFTDKDGHAIRTDRSYDKALLTSELPDTAFAQLQQLQITGPDGTVNFKTTGFARYNSEDSRCGSVVVVYTAMGFVQFDGAGMTFTETLVGAFQGAGFTVSNSRNRRRRVGRAGRSVDETVHTLNGITQIFGEFSFLGKLDLSELSCGDEVPELKAPFDGDNNDLQVEEEKLIACGSQTLVGPPCPAHADLTTHNGHTYYKRVTQMRSKKVGGVWHTIRSTAIPELDNNGGVADELRGGRYVEVSVGGVSQTATYQFFSNSSIGLARCAILPSIIDYASSLETNSADDVGSSIVKFHGYDVLNNHYVKHFKVFTEGGPKVGIDYYESFEEKRPYSFGVVAPALYTTYESIKTDVDVEPGFLQGDGYPSLEIVDGDEFLAAVTCNDEIEWDKLGSTDGSPSLALDELLQVSAMPDLGAYRSAPFVLAEFESKVALDVEAASLTIEEVTAVLDDEEPDLEGQRNRRGMAISCVHERAHELISGISSGCDLKLEVVRCLHPDKFELKASIKGGGRVGIAQLTGDGTAKLSFVAGPPPAFEAEAGAKLSVQVDNFPEFSFEFKATYSTAPPYGKPTMKGTVTLAGLGGVKVCGRRRERKAAADLAGASSSPEDDKYLSFEGMKEMLAEMAEDEMPHRRETSRLGSTQKSRRSLLYSDGGVSSSYQSYSAPSPASGATSAVGGNGGGGQWGGGIMAGAAMIGKWEGWAAICGNLNVQAGLQGIYYETTYRKLVNSVPKHPKELNLLIVVTWHGSVTEISIKLK